MELIARAAIIACLVLSPAIALAQDRFFDSSGVRIRYTDQGTGDAIVLIHGMTGSLQSWVDSGVLPNLVQNYRVVALDARGHGKSGKPRDVKAYEIEMGLDVVRLLNHLRIEQAHIVGYSMGAEITAQLLTTHPERFITATLGGSPGRFGWTPEDEHRNEQEASEIERECRSRTQFFHDAPVGEPQPTEEEFKKLSAACMADPNLDRFSLAALHRGSKNRTITSEAVAAVEVPTLGVVGSLDAELLKFRDLKKRHPALTLVVIDGATHGGVRGAMRRPEFIAAVRDFLSSAQAASPR
jgi:pimeloyl-ACP methyl ester carboxylesterase